MKTDIHPEYQVVIVTCSCGNTFETRSTSSDLHVELCSECHPFYTGKQKLVDTGGRIDRFERRFGKRKRSQAAETEAEAQADTEPEAVAEPETVVEPEAVVEPETVVEPEPKAVAEPADDAGGEPQEEATADSE